MMSEERHGSRNTRELTSDPQVGGRGRANWEWVPSKPATSDTHPPAEPHLLILPKQFNQLAVKHSSILTYEGHSHSNHQTSES